MCTSLRDRVKEVDEATTVAKSPKGKALSPAPAREEKLISSYHVHGAATSSGYNGVIPNLQGKTHVLATTVDNLVGSPTIMVRPMQATCAVEPVQGNLRAHDAPYTPQNQAHQPSPLPAGNPAAGSPAFRDGPLV